MLEFKLILLFSLVSLGQPIKSQKSILSLPSRLHELAHQAQAELAAFKQKQEQSSRQIRSATIDDNDEQAKDMIFANVSNQLELKEDLNWHPTADIASAFETVHYRQAEEDNADGDDEEEKEESQKMKRKKMKKKKMKKNGDDNVEEDQNEIYQGPKKKRKNIKGKKSSRHGLTAKMQREFKRLARDKLQDHLIPQGIKVGRLVQSLFLESAPPYWQVHFEATKSNESNGKLLICSALLKPDKRSPDEWQLTKGPGGKEVLCRKQRNNVILTHE